MAVAGRLQREIINIHSADRIQKQSRVHCFGYFKATIIIARKIIRNEEISSSDHLEILHSKIQRVVEELQLTKVKIPRVMRGTT